MEKAKRKGSDLTVANDVTKMGSGFGTDTNEVALIGADGTVERLASHDQDGRWPPRLWDRVGGALAGAD